MAKKKAVSKKSYCKGMGLNWLISEVAGYFSIWYLLVLLRANTANVWLSALLLLVLVNISIMFCPLVRKMCK